MRYPEEKKVLEVVQVLVVSTCMHVALAGRGGQGTPRSRALYPIDLSLTILFLPGVVKGTNFVQSCKHVQMTSNIILNV